MQHQQRADGARNAGRFAEAMALYKKVAKIWPIVETLLDCAWCAESLKDHAAQVSVPAETCACRESKIGAPAKSLKPCDSASSACADGVDNTGRSHPAQPGGLHLTKSICVPTGFALTALSPSPHQHSCPARKSVIAQLLWRLQANVFLGQAWLALPSGSCLAACTGLSHNLRLG